MNRTTIHTRHFCRLYLLFFALCLAGAVTAQSKIYYVSPTGTGDGSAWANTMNLSDALDAAKANDQIWLQGFEQITNADQLYVAPATGFTLKSGVQLYGGFAGTETNIDDRETLGKPYQLKYRSVLSGDINKVDIVDNTNLIYPANTTRDDNATHVLSLDMDPTKSSNNNTWPTVVNGLTIAGGHADGTDEKGGGIYVHSDNTDGGNYRIERCFFYNNYASQGGAIYVDAAVQNVNNGESLVSQCAVYNNAAGQRTTQSNSGGGIYLAGAGTIVNCAIFNNENGGVCLSANAKIINSTVTRNSGSGIDMTTAVASYNVYNTVIWGNSELYLTNKPNFKNSAFYEAVNDNTDNNIHINQYNNEGNSPFFSSPSVRATYDREFQWTNTAYPLWSWDLTEQSALIDKGDNNIYISATFGDKDMSGNSRINGTIDIGAHEFQPVTSTRIRYVKQGGTGDGTSWANASGNLQQMINNLADNNPQNMPGEVWVAAGTYAPQSQVISGTSYSASFRMRDGISVYGGFAGTETSKQERIKGDMPWEFTNRTILQGSYYSGNLSWNTTDRKWTLNSDSRHVVWFAPLPSEGKTAFEKTTCLNGVVIRGGYAQGGIGTTEFLTDRGAGVYVGGNAYVENCIVTENTATGNGGGIYLAGGRVKNSLVYNNNTDGNGGGIYVENGGLVLASMISNNSANNGAGVYLDHTETWSDGKNHPEYLLLSTSVVSNNTSRLNGAVYCNKGGVVLQTTITNNNCPTATDNTNLNASQTGGLYINEYGLIVNSVIWNNIIQGKNIPMYAQNPTADKVRFLYTAASGISNAVWNNTLQQEMVSLSEDNNNATDGILDPDFSTGGQMADNNALKNTVGVQNTWLYDRTTNTTSIDYFWKPMTGSNLRAKGMVLGSLPDEIVLKPEIDIEGKLFAQKPATGAFRIEATTLTPEWTNNTLILYVDVNCTEPTHGGGSWETAYRSLNEAISFFAGLKNGDEVNTYNNGKITKITLPNNFNLKIHVLEGNLYPQYAFADLDPKSATIDIPTIASGAELRIYGGYRRDAANTNTVTRAPMLYRSIINGNYEGKNLADGIYHCITIAKGAKVLIDGFHVINGYAAGEAPLPYGAGLLAQSGATVTLQNCIFENHTAQEGAAIDARDARLTLNNCVVNNNTNTVADKPVINAQKLTMNHVTVVNNKGAAPANMGTSSFSAGNSSGTNSVTLASVGAAGANIFANPTNGVGATLGFDTYLGGYSEFRPLTSSTDAGNLIINKVSVATGLSTDVTTVNSRDLGGIPDLGAYEADLPKAGKIIYVRSYNTVWSDRDEKDGSPNMNLETAGDGSSWENAINGNAICDLEQTVTGTEAGFYINDNGKLIQSSRDDSKYSDNGQYGPTAGNYGGFWTGNNSKNGYGDGGYLNYTIKNNRHERYVSGLQYAVEKAAELNKNIGADEEPVEVWVAAGIYTDYKGFVIRDKVKVLGGFPAEGIPGENDRIPLLSDYIPASDEYASLTKSDYETILQIRKEAPVKFTENNNATVTNVITSLNSTTRKYVLFQPDVCLPTWDVSGDGGTGGNVYRYDKNDQTNYDENYIDYEGATWDGFTVRHGYIKSYYSNRDGGAGIRCFRGVTLQNMVITHNCNYHNNRNRGGGLYMDGENSRINNSFILNNYLGHASESMGGGAYMIVGTGYNLVVANNHCSYSGGGVFMERASFFNNTVAYNRANSLGSGLSQWSGSTDKTKLELYNCIFYGNEGADVLYSNALDNFQPAYHCYIGGKIPNDLSGKFSTDNGNYTGEQLENPFSDTDPQKNNNYRLKADNDCVNNGTLYAGEIDINLPETDMDYTARIKDCTIDIGAYERSNQDNVTPNANGYYYVTQNGAGNACGNSPENAACAMKLQEVLNAAGKRGKNGQTAVVKIAGYANRTFVYHPNTLSNPNDPQSYSYVVPEGIIVEGGYNEEFTERKPFEYPTVLSAVSEASSSTIQTVRGYHAVTFGAWPGTAALTKPTIIDGLYLQDGSATSMAGTGNPNTRGGGAIVPSGAHVRNCVVMNCEAIEGGGLYLLPGGMVSGTLVYHNTAETGAGIYADNTNADNTTRAHLISCTVTDNEASSTGGGICLEDGAVMVLNSVFWGNTAPSDKNISGQVSKTYGDNLWEAVFGLTDEVFYPFNNCYVETYELPTNFENTSMTSNADIYFAGDDRTLKTYSPLIKHGTITTYYDKLQKEANVATQDMQDIDRIQTGNGAERLDAGAFAYEGGILPTDLFTRIFVSPTTNVTLPDEKNMIDYLGRSFYTSFSTLEDALGYIRSMREKGTANDATKFEILVAGGTYKPSYLRTTGAAVDHDQKLYSFVVPQGVSIYGGFSGTEKYSSSAIQNGNETSLNEIQIINADGTQGTITLISDKEPNVPIDTILAKRPYSDFNQNSILEPWELEYQTILSGEVNVSGTTGNAYHVLYSDAGTNQATVNPITLDGLTVMNGETSNELSNVANKDDQGRGGGIYSNGVSYLANRCRFLNNFAVRGGAIYMRDAKLTLIGSILGGNGTVDNPETQLTQPPRGGAVYMAEVLEKPKTQAALYAVNTLWVNNETSGQGGAIGTNYADGVSTAYVPEVSLMNNTFVRNRAQSNAIIYHHNGKNTITNTVMWGNEITGTNIPQTDETKTTITHSASDAVDLSKYSTTNIKLSTENMAADGPRFAKPSTAAGVAGYSANSLWNPAAISVLTDAGDGVNHIKTQTTQAYIDGAYATWMTTNADSYAEQYMGYTDYMTDYLRYAGPLADNGKEQDKTIDIGLYEYQYNLDKDIIYVATSDKGRHDGSSWDNATSDLRGALIAMANPDGGTQKNKKVYIQAGEYSLSQLSANTAYIISMADKSNQFGDSLEVRGSFNESGIQDFSQPTIITTQESNANSTKILMNVEANEKVVYMEGLTFINKNATNDGGTGIQASSTGGKLTLKNVAFRGNKNSGLEIVSGTEGGEFLLANTLFADGGTGLSGADNRTTVVNATFANNTVADMTFADEINKPLVYNSVSWNNTNNEPDIYKNSLQNLPEGNENIKINLDNDNKPIANDDLENGPNFKDPENTDIYQRDYSLRPSVMLLNKGDKNSYTAQVEIANFDDEKDLGDNKRLIDKEIDVGAYEYEAELQPIVYVKADLMVTADGKTWDTALGDLQGAVDLAGLYAKNNPGLNGYVFVHGNYHETGLLSVTLPNVRVYGSMNDERSIKTNTKDIVSDLLTKRKGMLEATERSSLEKVTIGADGVIDGFEVTGTATINAGALATSIVKNDVTKGKENGLLYNSFVEGSVDTVQAVNVTATGAITGAAGSGNNRQNVTDGTGGTEDQRNTYVTDNYWNYQLMETSTDIDPTDTRTDISTYMTKVGHERDLIGNKRIRNTVDNGCFETWNITADAEVTNDDYPRGKSVVYVRKKQELKINDNIYPDAATAFNPGFLLLEHQAGLRGNRNHISLTNFAVEREIPAGGADLIAMPFDVNTATSNLAGITPQRYNGSTRAAYTYKYDAANSTAWTTQNLDLAGMYEGLLFENKTGKDTTLRFYGKSTAPYTENGTDKSISLQKYNFNEPWATPGDGGNKFTHKENMSWNLFGSPYLCAMNYSDLEYGRMLYGYESNDYVTTNTMTALAGYVPAGSAVFTQSATLKDTETFSIAQPKGSKKGNPFQKSLNMAIYVGYTKTTASKATADYCSFNAVPAAEASNSFDLGSDGVKWLADNGKPQIYAIRNGGRYSLLSAVNEEAETEIGLLLPEAGNYVIGIGEGSERQEYEAVILIDRLNGTTTDLLDKDYTFSASEGGTLDDRFRITFNPEANRGLHGGPVVRIYPEGKVLVSGITDGEYVSAYNAAGMLIQRLPVTENHVWFKLQKGFYLFNIHYANDTDRALKAIVP